VGNNTSFSSSAFTVAFYSFQGTILFFWIGLLAFLAGFMVALLTGFLPFLESMAACVLSNGNILMMAGEGVAMLWSN
jgi:hypothetical protein